ncbi:MAG: glycosyltransferase family 39 protein [Elusimicrobia bacterium]|nr:glycosyltransferase family 39 protein [Elusimicrobiota bacterium]
MVRPGSRPARSWCFWRGRAASIRTGAADRDRLLLFLLAALIALHRLVYLHADPSGQYLNTDEGLHSNDARSIVLYGTPFHDTYNPSVLMPVSTWFKVPFLAVLGVNLYGVRVPSVAACTLAALLLSLALFRREERLAAVAALSYWGASYFYYSHSRLGIQDPILVLFAGLTVFFGHRALVDGRTSDYAWAFVSALAALLTKASGVFAPGALGLALSYKAFVRRDKVPWRNVGAAAAVAAGCGLAVCALWFRPHWDEARMYYLWEVASRKTPDIARSLQGVARAILTLAPVCGLLCASALVRLVRRPREADDLEILLFSWLGCAAAALAYSSLLFWRWVLWLFLPLTAIAMRELVRLAGSMARASTARSRAVAGAFVAAALAADLPDYARYYGTMGFYIWDGSKQVEAVVGGSVVAGSGFDDFAANSAKIDLVSSFNFSRLASCEEVRRAFPRPEMEPRFLGVHAGSDPAGFPGVVTAFFAGCPAWKAGYKRFATMRRINPPGSADIWFVRK